MSVLASSPQFPASKTYSQPVLTQQKPGTFTLNSLTRSISQPVAGAVNRAAVISVEPKRMKGATQARTYSDFWYNRIQIVPAAVRFGSIAGKRVAEVEVWNAYFDPKRLASVSVTANQGLSVNEPQESPTTFNSLESRIYEVVASGSGPPGVNGTVEFDWLFRTIDIPVTGQRLVPWPFPVNWADNFVESVAYKTEVLTAWNGTEQRLRHREMPRRTYEGNYVVSDQEAQRLLAVLWSWQARNYAVPLWHQIQRLTGPVAAGDKTIPVDTAYTEFVPGGIVGLYRRWDRFEALVVESVAADSIEVTQVVENDWTAGDFAMPVAVARLEESQTVTHATDRTVELTARWRGLDHHAPGEPGGQTTYQGKPVLLESPNWRQQPQGDFTRNVLEADYGWTPAFDDPFERAKTTYTFLLTLKGRSEIDWYRRWLHQRRGRQKSFWMPTWSDDLDLKTKITNGESAIEVETVGGERHYGDQGRNHLYIRTRSNTIYFREVLDIDTNVISELDVVSLDASIPETLFPEDILDLSFLVECRLDTDRSEITHLSDGVAETELAVRTV